MLTVKNLTHWYGQADKPLYEDVDLSFDSDKVYTIVGASGSGKTTFLSFIAGLDKPQKGDIFLDGINIKKIGATNYRKHKVAIVFQQPDLFTKICKIPIKHMHHAFDGYFVFSPFKYTKRASALV